VRRHSQLLPSNIPQDHGQDADRSIDMGRARNTTHPGTNSTGRAEGASEVEVGDSHQGGPQAEPHSEDCGLRSETHGLPMLCSTTSWSNCMLPEQHFGVCCLASHAICQTTTYLCMQRTTSVITTQARGFTYHGHEALSGTQQRQMSR
jgi:hypothetical protein